MKRLVCLLAIVTFVGTSTIMAQPPGGRGGSPGQRGGGRGQQGPGGGPGGSSNAVLAAIDADGDHVISAQEIMNAAAALKKLDLNKDGKLTSDEVHPSGGQGQGGGPGGPPGGGEGGPGGGGRGAHGPGGGGPGGGGPGGGGPGGQGPGHGEPPTAQQFMERAMTFDVDKDGKLSEVELKKMAAAVVEEMSRRGGPPGGGQGGGGGPRGGGGRGGEGSTNRQRPAIDD